MFFLSGLVLSTIFFLVAVIIALAGGGSFFSLKMIVEAPRQSDKQ